VVVSVQGENSLEITVDGNINIGSHLDLNGASGQLGIYSGRGGPGGWASGRGLRNTDLFANLHPALNGQDPVVDGVMKLASPLEVEVMEVWVQVGSVEVCQALFMVMI
jgi:hypothetical protein